MVATQQTQEMAIEKTEKTESLAEFLKRPDILERFAYLYPTQDAAKRHIQSVLIQVASSDPGEYSLQNCSHESVLKSALRAASLRVSVDPAIRQAWLVPRKNKKTNRLECNLQLHYAEVLNRAVRTGVYMWINVGPVYEGETVYQDVYSGFHQVQLAGGLMTSPTLGNGFIKVGERQGKVIGWLGYYETMKRAKCTVYMSIEDIVAFISLHNPYWTTSKAWRENRQTMEQKTVLLSLLRKADLGDPKMQEVRQIVNDEYEPEAETIDGELEYVGGEFDQTPPAPAAPVVIVSAPAPDGKKILTYNVAKEYIVNGKRLDDRSIDELQVMATEKGRAESTLNAIKVVLDFKIGRAMMENKGGAA